MLNLCQYLEKIGRAKIHVVPVDAQGRLDLDFFRAALSDKTALVTIQWANNETGVIFPVAELAAQAKSVGALFHTDAVQAFGKIPLALKDTAIDMLSLSSHKLHGPKGVGALYVKKGVKLTPLFRGGKQERGRRAGTENTPGIVGLGAAAGTLRQAFRGGLCARKNFARPAGARTSRKISRIAGSMAAGRNVCPIPAMSLSTPPTARRCCTISTARGSPPLPVRPAPRARWSRAMFCAR